MVDISRLLTREIGEAQRLIEEAAGTMVPFSEFASCILTTNGDAFAAKQDGRLIGVLLGVHMDHVSIVVCVAVNPAYRHHGVATHLLDAFLDCCCNSSVCRLEVLESNAEALQLYLDSGFHATGAVRKYWSSPGGMVEMERSLAPLASA